MKKRGSKAAFCRITGDRHSLLVFNDHTLIDAAEEGFLRPDELVSLACVVLELVLPQCFGEWLKVMVSTTLSM